MHTVGSKAWCERILAQRVNAQRRAVRSDLPAEAAIEAVNALIGEAFELGQPDVPVLRIENSDVRGGPADALRRYLEVHAGPVVDTQYKGTAMAVVIWCTERGYRLSLARHLDTPPDGAKPVYLVVRPDALAR